MSQVSHWVIVIITAERLAIPGITIRKLFPKGLIAMKVPASCGHLRSDSHVKSLAEIC